MPPQEVTNQVAVQIKKAIGQGNDQIRIQLKPAELGRVEVKLEVSENGRAVAVVSAERPETLDLLQRDAAGLRQALQDAGLSTDLKSLSFNLQGEGSKFEKEMAERGHARAIAARTPRTLEIAMNQMRKKPHCLPLRPPRLTAGSTCKSNVKE